MNNEYIHLRRIEYDVRSRQVSAGSYGYRQRLEYTYEDNVLSRINLENGYISLRDGAGTDAENPHYHVFLRDHLGNNRVDLDMTAGGEICQIMHYYPFGLPMNAGYRRDTQRWLFGGKELDRMAGLDQYDFEARMYDPATIRFTRMDDMAEKYQPASPYAYCLNNPLVNIDPTGLDVWQLNLSGKMVKHIRTKKYDKIQVVDNKNNIRVDEHGKNIEITLKYGSIKKKHMTFYKKQTKYDVYVVKGDRNGKAVFEFLSNNISTGPEYIEFSWAETGDKYTGDNYIFTSFESHAESGFGSYLNSSPEFRRKGFIRKHVHTHPTNSAPDANDKELFRDIKRIFKYIIPAYIYFPKNKKYIKYYPR